MSNPNCDKENDDDENNQVHNFINDLYRCYEENGFLRSLSNQVRNQMFSTLQNFQGPVSTESDYNRFFKLPILGLLVAEFLLQIKCFSTLLSFKSEKSNLKNVQNFIENVGELSDKLGLEPIGTIRLKQPDVTRLLENMGLRPEIANAIISLYYNSNEESLLTCILQVLINGKQKRLSIPNDEPSTSTAADNDEPKKEQNLPAFCSKCFTSNREVEIQKDDEEEKKRIEKELKEKEMHLAELAINLKQQHDMITQKLEHVEDTAQILKQQEKEIKNMKSKESIRLQERSSELNLKQHQLDLEFKRLQKERASMQKVRGELEDTRRQLEIVSQSLIHSRNEVSFLKDLQLQCVYLREELDETKKKLNSKSMKNTEQEDLEDNLMQSIIRQLRQENADLRNQTQLQKMRIDELEGNSARLNNRLTEALSFQGTITAPTLDAPPPRPYRRVPLSPGQERQLGSGEVLASVNNSRPVNYYSRYRHLNTREMRRKPPERLLISSENSSDESSSLTDDILVEARMRLRKLEEESAAVDRSFRNFRIRQATCSTSNPFSHLGYDFSQPQRETNFNFQMPPTPSIRKNILPQETNIKILKRDPINIPKRTVPFLPYSEIAQYSLPLLSSSDGLESRAPTLDSCSSENSRLIDSKDQKRNLFRRQTNENVENDKKDRNSRVMPYTEKRKIVEISDNNDNNKMKQIISIPVPVSLENRPYDRINRQAFERNTRHEMEAENEQTKQVIISEEERHSDDDMPRIETAISNEVDQSQEKSNAEHVPLDCIQNLQNKETPCRSSIEKLTLNEIEKNQKEHLENSILNSTQQLGEKSSRIETCLINPPQFQQIEENLISDGQKLNNNQQIEAISIQEKENNKIHIQGIQPQGIQPPSETFFENSKTHTQRTQPPRETTFMKSMYEIHPQEQTEIQPPSETFSRNHETLPEEKAEIQQPSETSNRIDNNLNTNKEENDPSRTTPAALIPSLYHLSASSDDVDAGGSLSGGRNSKSSAEDTW